MGFTFEFFVNMHFVIETHFLNLIFILYSSIVDPGGAMVKNCLPMQETLVQSVGQEDIMKKEMATHSSILTWRIPRIEEPGGCGVTKRQT